MYVLDACVVIKWFAEEENSGKALKFLQGQARGDFLLVEPDLLVYEIANVLKYSKAFSEEEVIAAIQSLYNLKIDFIAPIITVVRQAVTLSYEKDITYYDASYVALATELEVPFVTADARLYGKVQDISLVRLLKGFEFRSSYL